MIISVEQYLALVESGDPEAREAIRNEVVTEQIWVEILKSKPELVRVVALNRHLPESVVRKLAAHPDVIVRIDIANKRALTDEVFELLAADVDESVRARGAWNKKTPTKILHRLENDQESIVSEPAKNQLSSRLDIGT